MLSLVVVFFLSLASALGETAQDHDQKVVCYVATWSVYRPGRGQFNLDNVDPLLCTDLVYSFTGIDENTYAIKPLDPEFDINKGGFKKAIALRKINPKLKVTVAVGGWVEGSEKYSNMSSTPGNRRAFINSVVDFLNQFQFDGLDLDWEYPANRGGRPEDKENFIQLAKELRDAFKPYGWILTAAVASGRSVADSAYDIPKLGKYLDFIHLMAYDYHGKWDGKTGHNAPLYPRVDESEFEQTLNVNFSVRHYVQSGLPVEKFVLGLGLYGRTFMLNNTGDPGIGAAAMKTSFAGPYTREDGFLGYNEICEKQLTEKGWSIAWQRAHQAPYMFKDKMWVSFDDMNSLGLKVAFAQRLGLAGVMVWSIDTDDFRGTCTGNRFPLLKSINKNLVIHAPERFQEKINVVATAKPKTTTIPSIRPGIPLPGDDRPGVPIPEIHQPGISRPGVPLPGDIPDVHRPPVYLPDGDRPGIDHPSQPGVPLPGYPHDPTFPGVYPPGVYHPDLYDDLDGDKPTRTEIDLDISHENDVDDRYHPAAGRGRGYSGSERTSMAPMTILTTVFLAYIFSY